VENSAILLMGPTASGKSSLALRLAEKFPLEIVSVDSAAVYRHMDIGTAKPSPQVQAQFPHHLIDRVDPTQAYSAARFCEEAREVMAVIRARHKWPLLVGGTMLYFKALCEGLDAMPQADPEVRRQLDEEAAAHGWQHLHRQLAQVDPITAQRLPPTDSQRIQRALEVYRITGMPISELQGKRTAETLRPAQNFLSLGFIPSERAVLHERIAQRFDLMLQQGLEDELLTLRQRYRLEPNLPSMRSVGYRQMWEYLEGRCSFAEMRYRGIVATRQLAKRQLTWLRGWPGLEEFDSLEEAAGSRVEQRVARFLEAL
jgi:tRNA dimethylallyltransferase